MHALALHGNPQASPASSAQDRYLAWSNILAKRRYYVHRLMVQQKY